MMQYVILETLTGVSEIILVFHEVKKRCYLREAANIHPEMHNILVFLSTLFSILFTSKTYRTTIEDISKRACVNCFIHPHMVCLLHRLTRTCNIKHQSCKSIYHYCNNEIENSRNSTAFCYLHFGIIPFLTIIYDSAFVCRYITIITPLFTILTHGVFPLSVISLLGICTTIRLMLCGLLVILSSTSDHTTFQTLMRTILIVFYVLTTAIPTSTCICHKFILFDAKLQIWYAFYLHR